MSILSFFPTQIDHSKKVAPPSLNRDLIREISQLQEMDRAGADWSKQNYFAGYTSYGSLDKLHLSSPNFAELEKHIKPKVAAFARVLEWDIQPYKLKMNSCWVNVMPQGAHHSFHIHPGSVISGTYYVEVPKTSSPLKFEDPRLSKMMLAPQKKVKCKAHNKTHIEIFSQSRDLILFESWLRHEVPANRVKNDRISVSFNYSF